MTYKESPEHIAPWVLPTQLESNDSDSGDDKTEDEKTLPNEDKKADDDVDGHENAGFLELDITTHRDDHFNEEESKKLCRWIMRLESTVLSSNTQQMHLFQSGPFDDRLSLQKKVCRVERYR